MRLCRLWHALGRSVGRSAACYVTYWPRKRQNGPQNGLQWPCVTVWGLVWGATAAHDTVPGVPGCYHGRAGRPDRRFEGARGAAPDLGPAKMLVNVSIAASGRGAAPDLGPVPLLYVVRAGQGLAQDAGSAPALGATTPAT